jgi:release factor glutamine methyltransferase
MNSIQVTGRGALPMSDAGMSAPTRRALLRHCVALLRKGGLDPQPARQEATWLVVHGLGVNQLGLEIEPEQTVTAEQWDQVSALCARRARREPLQYLLGDQDFCGLTLRVQPGVLIPRPETELLVEAVVGRTSDRAPIPLIVDLGTGSGCIAIALAHQLPRAVVYATDASPEALALARDNADRLVGPHRIQFLKGDLCEPLGELHLEGRVTVLVSNPPYLTDAEMGMLQPEVKFEPKEALAGGPDGLTMYRRLVLEAVRFLAPGGLLAMEVGAGQAPAVRRMLTSARVYDDLCTIKDAAGIERVVTASKA